ncbi:MAG TPA: hypothetical protein VGE67_13955 [Haloferula sp.]
MDKPQQADGAAASEEAKNKRWEPPRGIRFIDFEDRPSQPYGVQWRVEKKRKTKTFATREAQITFAKALAGAAKREGLAAFKLDPDETKAWRAFRADIGDASLEDVLRCWRRYGKVAAKLKLVAAKEAFLKAKEAEGVSAASLGHFRPVLRDFSAALGDVELATIQREQLEQYLAEMDTDSTETRRTHYKRIRSLFSWLEATRQIAENPCDGWKSPREGIRSISVLPVAEAVRLFAENAGRPQAREVLGRLALEAFAGVRHETAARLTAPSFDFERKVITIPAAIDKNRKDQFIEHAPENLWAWLRWSDPAKWSMNPIAYRNAKSAAFLWARVEHAHNVLRHSAASYHIAMNGDAGKTAAMLTHANLKMLWSNYRGRGGGEANGRAWFSILPPAGE